MCIVTLSSNAGCGPFPGVIDMFGGVGGTVEHRSALLASRGVASMSLAYITEAGVGVTDMEYYEVRACSLER